MKPFRKTTPSGVLLPNACTVDVRLSETGPPGTLHLRYTETLPSRDVHVIRKTLEYLRAVSPGLNVRMASVEPGTTTFQIDTHGTHEQIGSILGSEFMGWSPLGTRSICDVFFLLVGKAHGVDLRAPKPVAKKKRGTLRRYLERAARAKAAARA